MSKNKEGKPPKIKKVFMATRVLPILADKIKAGAAAKDRSVAWVINDILTKHFFYGKYKEQQNNETT